MILGDFLSKDYESQLKSIMPGLNLGHAPLFIKIHFKDDDKYFIYNVSKSDKKPYTRNGIHYVPEYIEIRTDGAKNKTLSFKDADKKCSIFAVIKAGSSAMAVPNFLRMFRDMFKKENPVIPTIIGAIPDYIFDGNFYIYKDGNYHKITYNTDDQKDLIQGTLLGSYYGYAKDDESRYDVKWIHQLLQETKISVYVELPILGDMGKKK